MRQATPRCGRRWLTLGVVLGLHAALLRSMLAAGPAGPATPATPMTLVVSLLPATQPPRIRSEPAPLRHLDGAAVDAVRPAALGTLPMAVAPASLTGGSGAGVDWAAEARRALHAFEIRSHGPPTNTTVSGESEEEWLRQLSHHVGDQVRTPSGDWVIWISADCYQVAKSISEPDPTAGRAPPILCVDRSRSTAR